MVPSAHQTFWATELLTKWTLPSQNKAFTPPE